MAHISPFDQTTPCPLRDIGNLAGTVSHVQLLILFLGFLRWRYVSRTHSRTALLLRVEERAEQRGPPILKVTVPLQSAL
jgi:hypothetical protein